MPYYKMGVSVKPQISLDLAQLKLSSEKLNYEKKRQMFRHNSNTSSDWTKQRSVSSASDWTRQQSESSASLAYWTNQPDCSSTESNWTQKQSVFVPDKNRARSASSLRRHIFGSKRQQLLQSGSLVESRRSSLDVKSRPSTGSSVRRRMNSKDIVHHLYDVWLPQLSENYRPFAYFISIPESYRSMSRCSEFSERSLDARNKMRAAESVVEVCNRIQSRSSSANNSTTVTPRS